MKNLHNLGTVQWREGDMRALPMRVHCCHQGNTQFFPPTLEWTGVFVHSWGTPHHPAGKGPSCLCSFLWSLDHEAGDYFYEEFSEISPQRIFHRINLQTILGLNFVWSPFHRCRNWEVQTRATHKSHSWWGAKSGFQCVCVWLQGPCSLLCKRMQPH